MQGEILGTLQYMSPEHLQGKEVDARSDLFSFGCVLYELVTSKRAFEGTSAASVIAAILEREPEPIKTTPPLDRLIRRCLQKDPDDRFQTARDLKFNLGLAIEVTTLVGPTVNSRGRLVWVLFAAMGVRGWCPALCLPGNELNSARNPRGHRDSGDQCSEVFRAVAGRTAHRLRCVRRWRFAPVGAPARFDLSTTTAGYGRRGQPLLVARQPIPRILRRREVGTNRSRRWTTANLGRVRDPRPTRRVGRGGSDPFHFGHRRPSVSYTCRRRPSSGGDQVR